MDPTGYDVLNVVALKKMASAPRSPTRWGWPPRP